MPIIVSAVMVRDIEPDTSEENKCKTCCICCCYCCVITWNCCLDVLKDGCNICVSGSKILNV